LAHTPNLGYPLTGSTLVAGGAAVHSLNQRESKGIRITAIRTVYGGRDHA
jgi:hypothetical protein